MLTEQQIDEIFARTAATPGYQLTIDLEKCEITDNQGLKYSFEVQESRRHSLLNGLDDIAMSLQHEAEITRYEQLHGIA